MLLLVRYFLDLVLLKLPPQAFPASRLLFAITLTGFAGTRFLDWYLATQDLLFSLLRTGLSLINLSAGTAVILLLWQRLPRWQQTMTAFMGGEAVLTLIVLPLMMVYAMGISNIFITLSFLSFMLWELIFFAHVWRHALDRGMGAGMLVALAYTLASSYIKQLLLPVPGGIQ